MCLIYANYCELSISIILLIMSKCYTKCFVTVGTTRFDRLCEFLLSSSILLALKKLGCKELTVQIGNSDVMQTSCEKEGVKIDIYRFKDSIQNDINDADLVISHAGAGSVLETLEAKKPLVVVVNEDLMDNHQLELAEQLQVDGHLYYCTCDTLENTLNDVDFTLLKPFPKPDPRMFLNYLDNVFKTEGID